MGEVIDLLIILEDMKNLKNLLRRRKQLYYMLLKLKNINKIVDKLLLHLLFNIISIYKPLDEKKIICSSFNNTKIACNPKSITEYILNNYPEGSYEIVWIYNGNDDKSKSGFKTVKFKSIEYVIEAATAKYFLYNKRIDFLVPKRKGQIYIQMWHSSARLKKIEGDASQHLSSYYLENAKKDSKKIDIMVSGSQHSTEIYRRAFWFDGIILNIGTPRNDIFFNYDIGEINQIKEKIGISIDENVILYVPTFRSNYEYDYSQFDGKRIIRNLENTSGEKWKLLIRYHPNMIKEKVYSESNDVAMNVSNYDDIQDLLLIADCIVTDYSSVMFDFSLSKKPVYLFTPDLLEYYAKERDLYFKVEDLPFPLSMNMDELESNINNFNKSKYEKDLDAFLDTLGSYEKGNACSSLMNYLDNIA